MYKYSLVNIDPKNFDMSVRSAIVTECMQIGYMPNKVLFQPGAGLAHNDTMYVQFGDVAHPIPLIVDPGLAVRFDLNDIHIALLDICDPNSVAE